MNQFYVSGVELELLYKNDTLKATLSAKDPHTPETVKVVTHAEYMLQKERAAHWRAAYDRANIALQNLRDGKPEQGEDETT